MAIHTSIHYAHKIRAEAGTTTGAPLIVKIDRDNGGVLGDEVTLFTDDHELTRLLADAINAAVAARSAAKDEREAALDTKTIDTIKALRSAANNFAGFHALYAEKYASDNNCDKKGYGFGADNRFSAFEIKTSFDSWAGYYGNSSCSTVMSVYHTDLVRPFVINALNVHQKEIFATVARLMREEAARLTDKAQAEVIAIQVMLEAAKADLAETSEAA